MHGLDHDRLREPRRSLHPAEADDSPSRREPASARCGTGRAAFAPAGGRSNQVCPSMSCAAKVVLGPSLRIRKTYQKTALPRREHDLPGETMLVVLGQVLAFDRNGPSGERRP